MNNNQKFHTVRGYELLKQENKLLTSSMEDYLEMIYRSSLEEDYMRINNLADLLNVQASSATKMVQKLTSLGFVDYKKYGIILLTDRGKEIGRFLLKRHEIIETFLKYLGVSQNILAETEMIEHNISNATLEKIDMLNKFFEMNADFIERLYEFIDSTDKTSPQKYD